VENQSGLFIAIEGASGVGKSTIIQELKTTFAELEYLFTKEPTPNFKLSQENTLCGNDLFELLLEDRENHIQNDIIPSLNEGKVIFSDRYVLSSLVFQRLDGLDLEYIWSKNSHFIVPQLTYVIITDEETRTQRLESRTTLSRLKQPEIRMKEVQYTREASDLLKSKGWNISWIDNTKSISASVKSIHSQITSYQNVNIIY
jgi:dTMP kinase